MESENTLQKRIKDYVISCSSNEFYGKGIKGQLRVGYSQQLKKIYIFRINSLPISNQLKKFIQLQKQYSNLSQFGRKIQLSIQTSSNIYLPMEYFPKTFKTQLQQFQSNIRYAEEMVEKYLRTYAYFYYLKIAHNNININNVGITFQLQVKLMDFQSHPQGSSQMCPNKDLKDTIEMIKLIFKNCERQKKIQIFFKNDVTWEEIFRDWSINCFLAPLYLSKRQPYQKMILGIGKLINCLSSQNIHFLQLKYSYLLLILSHLKKCKNRTKQKELLSVLQPIRNIEYWNSILKDTLKDYKYFKISSMQRLILIFCLNPILNHQYLLNQYIQLGNNQMKSKQDQILGNNLLKLYQNLSLIQIQ